MSAAAWIALAVVVAVAVAGWTWVVQQASRHAHHRWLREFDAAQKPQVELAALRAEFEQRILDLEKKANGLALKSLGTR